MVLMLAPRAKYGCGLCMELFTQRAFSAGYKRVRIIIGCGIYAHNYGNRGVAIVCITTHGLAYYYLC